MKNFIKHYIFWIYTYRNDDSRSEYEYRSMDIYFFRNLWIGFHFKFLYICHYNRNRNFGLKWDLIICFNLEAIYCQLKIKLHNNYM